MIARLLLLIATASLAFDSDLPESEPVSAPQSQPASQLALPADAPTRELSAASQPASDETFVAPPKKPRGPWFEMWDLAAELGIDAHWDRRQTLVDTRQGTRDRQTDSQFRLEETFGLAGRGTLLDPNLLRYDFNIRSGLTQERFRESRSGPDRSADPNGGLLEYDIHATFLPAGKLSGNLYASKLDDRVSRRFLPSLDRERERYGAELLFSDDKLPMRLAFESLYEELLSPVRRSDDDERTHERSVDYEATWRSSDRHELRLNYNYADRDEQYSGGPTTYDTTRSYLTLDDLLRFGKDDRSRLETIARIQSEGGDLARDQFEIAPRLHLQHTDKFATDYGVQYLKDSYEGIDVEQSRADVGGSLRWSDALDSSFNLYALTRNAEHGRDTDEWGATGTLGFHRDNSLGRFSTNLTYNHARQSADFGDDEGVVVNESVTLRDPLPTYLAQTQVRRASIVVLSSDRRRTYLAGRDYLTIQSGSYTALRRSPGGRINDGDTVLVSYVYRTRQDFTLDRDRVDLRVQQDFKGGWTPYYAGSLQYENLDNDDAFGLRPRDVDRHRIGLNYKQPRWSAGAELEYNYDSIDPYLAGHFNTDITLLHKGPHDLSVRGTYSYFDFHGLGGLSAHDAGLLDLGLAYRATLSSAVEASATAAYRYEDDSLDGITRGVDLSAGVDWRIGLFTARFEIEYDLLDLPNSTDGTVAAWIKLRRGIPIIADSR